MLGKAPGDVVTIWGWTIWKLAGSEGPGEMYCVRGWGRVWYSSEEEEEEEEELEDELEEELQKIHE